MIVLGLFDEVLGVLEKGGVGDSDPQETGELVEETVKVLVLGQSLLEPVANLIHHGEPRLCTLRVPSQHVQCTTELFSAPIT